MILKKTLTMVPVLLGISAGIYDYQGTNIIFNEKSLGKNLQNISTFSSDTRKLEEFFSLDGTYLESRIRFYNKRWLKQTKILSDIHAIIDNVNFQQIIALGDKAIPFILKELQSNPSKLVWAMNLITGKKISNLNLTIKESSNSWIKWGIINRIIQA